MLDKITKGYTWRCEVLVSPTDGDTNSDVVTALTGGTPYIKLLDTAGAEELAETAGTLDASTRTLVYTLATATTGALTVGQYRAVLYVVNGSDKWKVGPTSDNPNDLLVSVENE